MSLFRATSDHGDVLALKTRVARLEEQVVRLEAALESALQELGSAPREPVGPAREVAPEVSYPEARALAAEGRRVGAIQLVMEQSGMSLKAAKDLVDGW